MATSWDSFNNQTLTYLVMIIISLLPFAPKLVLFASVSLSTLGALLLIHDFITRSPIIVQDADEARKILKESTFLERSYPNVHTAAIFEIENAFTTFSSEYRNLFVRNTKNQIRMSQVGWQSLAQRASHTVRSDLAVLTELPWNECRPMSNLRLLVQCLVFQVCLAQLFFAGDDSHLSASDGVKRMVVFTNALFKVLPEKHRGPDDTEIHFIRVELEKCLRQAFSDVGIPYPSDIGHGNPMNQLLTAYGATERVVLRCFLEVRFRMDSRNYHYAKEQFRIVSDDPAGNSFRTRHRDTNFSIRDIVNEALRLYPPPKNINRLIDGRMYVIDVEHIQRDEQHWGLDLLQFRPGRWIHSDRVPKAFMPFGVGPLSCPTQLLFGPRLIGVLVAALVANIDERFELSGPGSSEVLLDRRTPLEAGREDYPELVLRLRHE